MEMIVMFLAFGFGVIVGWAAKNDDNVNWR